jgi:hypothetical protein
MNWHPEKFINCDKIKQLKHFAVVVLNRPITTDKEIVESLWNHGENN